MSKPRSSPSSSVEDPWVTTQPLVSLAFSRVLVLGSSIVLTLLLTLTSLLSPVWHDPSLFFHAHNQTFMHFLYTDELHWKYEPWEPSNETLLFPLLPTTFSYPLGWTVARLIETSPTHHLVCSVVHDTDCCLLRTLSTRAVSLVGWLPHVVSTEHLAFHETWPSCRAILWCEASDSNQTVFCVAPISAV